MNEFRDRRKKVAPKKEGDEIALQSELRVNEGAHRRKMSSDRSSWVKKSSENGVSTYETPEGVEFVETTDKHGNKRLTLTITEEEREKIEKEWPKA